MNKYDVIVVGGGHAGVEAAHAVFRLGLKCALVTFEKNKIGQMSCNPAIGGLGKSHIVREVDALGGIMAVATDMSGIQYRTLNTRKGDAVQALRVQYNPKKNLFSTTGFRASNWTASSRDKPLDVCPEVRLRVPSFTELLNSSQHEIRSWVFQHVRVTCSQST